MSIAEQIYESVKTLPERSASEVLRFVKQLQLAELEQQQKRTVALEVLRKYRGRYQAEPFVRDDCYDR